MERMRVPVKIALYTLIIFTFYTPLSAQTNNPFLENTFWREDPSLKTIREKLNEGHSLTELSYRGYDVLSTAIIHTGNLDIAELLVEHGADIHKKIQRSGRTPIFWAVSSNNLPLVKFLVSKGAKLDVVDEEGNNLLLFAAANGVKDKAIYSFLENNGLSFVQSRDGQGRNALLLYASHLEDMKMVNYFLSKGISINAIDNTGNGVFDYAASQRDEKLLQQLIRKGAFFKSSNPKIENAFNFATQGGGHSKNKLTIALFEYLDSLGLEANITLKDGQSCMQNIAYSSRDIELFKFLVAKGVDPKQRTKSGETPLLSASFKNTEEVLSYLIKISGLDHRNKKGENPLSKALRRNTPEMVEFFLKKGISVHSKDNKGNDMGAQLVNSRRSGDRDNTDDFHNKLEVLKKYGYDPSKAAVQNGNSLYQIAIKNGAKKMVGELIKLGLPLDHKNNEGNTPLHIAAMISKDTDILKQLLKAGADKTLKNNYGESALELAEQNELFKKNKIDLDFWVNTNFQN